MCRDSEADMMFVGNPPGKGVLLVLHETFVLIVAPLVVAVLTKVVEHWLGDRDDKD